MRSPSTSYRWVAVVDVQTASVSVCCTENVIMEFGEPYAARRGVCRGSGERTHTGAVPFGRTCLGTDAGSTTASYRTPTDGGKDH